MSKENDIPLCKEITTSMAELTREEREKTILTISNIDQIQKPLLTAIIKSTTDLCDTFCCYEDCEGCVSRYLNWLSSQTK